MIGIGVSPDEAALALRGIETMGLRMRHMGQVSEDFARRLADQVVVDTVLHPALPSCPGHEFWKRDFAGSSAVFSIVVRPAFRDRVYPALSALKVFAIGASWGGTHSLIAPMAISGDRTINPWSDDKVVLRISVGLEDPDDLWDDLARLLSAIESGPPRTST
jgi:cystathionine beta-lyase